MPVERELGLNDTSSSSYVSPDEQFTRSRLVLFVVRLTEAKDALIE